MSFSDANIVGTIRVEPLLSGRQTQQPTDDSTMDLLFDSFAHQACLGAAADELPRAVRLVAAARLCRSAHEASPAAVRANLAQLLDDLDAEYKQLRG